MAISGVPGSSLVPEVPAQAVRDEAAHVAVERHDSALADPEYLANGWGQPHEVLTSCRILYSATTGAVCGKTAAAQWCLDAVTDEWHPLIRAAIRDRPDPWQRVHRRADPELAAVTAPFITYMKSRILEAAERPALS